MAAKLAELLVSLGIDSASFNSDLDKALGKSLTFKNAWQTISKALVSAGALAGTAFAGLAKHSINAADNLGNLAQSAGVTVESLSALAYAGESAGVSAEDLAQGFRQLAGNMSEAQDGTGEAAAAFDALGVSIKNADGTLRPQQEVLLDVAEAFSQYSDGAEKTAIAQDIFGRSGADLIPMLNMGRDGIGEMTTEAERLGLVLRSDTSEAASEFNQHLDTMSGVFKGIINQATADMLPVMKELAGTLAEDAKQSNALREAADLLSGSFKVLVSAGILLKNIFDVAGEVIGSTAAMFVAAAKGDFAGAYAALTESNEQLEAEVNDIRRAYQALWGESSKGPAESPSTIDRPNRDWPGNHRGGNRGGGGGSVKGPQRDEVAETIAQLEREAATLGMTADQVQLYELRLAGATDAQLAYAQSLQNNAEAFSANNERAAELAASYERNLELITGQDSATLAYNETLAQLNELYDAGLIPNLDEYTAAVGRAQEAFAQTREQASADMSAISQFTDEAARNMQDALAEFFFDPFSDGLDGMVAKLGDTLRRMVADAAAAQLAEAIFGKSGSGGQGGWLGQAMGLVGNWLGGGSTGGEQFGAVDFNAQPNYGLGEVNYGGRAIGGPVVADQMYKVGENGPEWFVPEMNGRIVKEAGGSVQNFNVTVMAPEGRISRQTDLQLKASLASAVRHGTRNL